MNEEACATCGQELIDGECPTMRAERLASKCDRCGLPKVEEHHCPELCADGWEREGIGCLWPQCVAARERRGVRSW